MILLKKKILDWFPHKENFYRFFGFAQNDIIYSFGVIFICNIINKC